MRNKSINSMPISPQAQQKGTAFEEESQIVQLIVFNLGDEEYGANINQVREIIRTGNITPIPDSPDFIKGVCNVRGEIPVIIDLKERFFLPIKKDVEDKHIVMTERDKNVFGLLVDEVTEVLRIPQTDIKTAPELVTKIDREYVNGVITLENRLIILLDLHKVLSPEELARLTELYHGEHRGQKTENTKAKHIEVSAKAEEPERKVKEPEQKVKEPERKAKEPEQKVKETEQKVKKTERKAKEPQLV
jgi:purine-binding chemotaxis protein CheW